MIKPKTRLYYFFYGLLSLIIVISVGELNKPFFSLDFPIGPSIYYKSLFPSFYGFETPIWGGHLIWKLMYSFLAFTFSAPIMQKILLFSILFLAGYSAHQVVPVNSERAKLFAGLLYMLNPYTYIRIIVGHWLILFAYAVLPLALKAFIELLEKKGRKETVKFVLLLTLVGFNSHTLVIALIAIVIIFLFWLGRSRDREVLRGTIFAGILFIFLNIYWLIPFATANDTLINTIGDEDLAIFTPRIESFSSLFTLASMHGFWRDGYVYAKDFFPYWQVLFVIILFLTVHGFISHYRDGKIGTYVKAFGVIAASGLILAAGINSPFSAIFSWLFDHTLLKGMRDSHKFVTLLVLAYSYLGALGVSEFEKVARNTSALERRKKFAMWAVIVVALTIPFVYSFTFFNGFAGQIKSTDYPPDWYEVNDILNQDAHDFNVLFFPWHQYMNFHWVPNRDKRIANPAQYFFDKEVVSGNNAEIGEIYRQVYSPDQLYIDFLLKEQANITKFGELVAPLNIKYVLLTKEVDYKNYFFLFNQSDLELVKETENFYVFRNKHEVAKIYEVDSIAYIRDWKELLERSRNEDITERAYLIGDSPENTQENSSKKLLDYQKESPVKYTLTEDTSKKYLVFTEPYSASWELDGKKPMGAYGVVNAYETGGANGGEILFRRFYNVYLPSYIISILTFIALIVFYLDIHGKISRVRWQKK
jgi:hypothetical protein